MVKLSEQIEEASKRAGLPFIPTRQMQKVAEIRRIRELRIRRKEIEEEQEKVKGMTLAEYEEHYPTIPEYMREFFFTPEHIRGLQRTEIKQNVEKVDTRIDDVKVKLEKVKAERLREQTEFSKMSSQQRDRQREDYKKRQDEYYDEIEKLKYTAQLLKETKPKASQGFEFSSIIDYVESKVDYRTAKMEARRRAKERSEEAYRKLTGASAFAPVFEKYHEKFKFIDWTDPKNIKRILQERFITQFGVERFIESKTRGLDPDINVVDSKIVTSFRRGDKTLFKATKKGEDITFKEIGTDTRGTFKFKEIPKVTTIAPPPIAEIPISDEFPILQLQPPSDPVEPSSADIPDAEEIVEETDEKIKKKRKWGITLGKTAIFGVRIPQLVTKSNPHNPVRPTDMLVRVGKEVGQIGKESGKKTFQFMKEFVPKPVREFPSKVAERVRPSEEKVAITTAVSEIPEQPKPPKVKVRKPAFKEVPREELSELSLSKVRPRTTYDKWRGADTTLSYDDYKKNELLLGRTTEEKIEVEEAPPYDLKNYKLYHNPKTNEMTYFPKTQTTIPKNFKRIERLAYNPEIDDFKSLKFGEKAPKDYITVNPTDPRERTYGAMGIPEERYWDNLKRYVKTEASLHEKVAFLSSHSCFKGLLGITPL